MADQRPIIIKKVKGGGHGGHHGGAWKVAYADFVTAMMAFFLLLWLLSATPAENLEGLADFFSPTMGVKDRMGIGFRGGKGVAPDGVSAEDWASTGFMFGAPPSGSNVRLNDGTTVSGDGGSKSSAEYFTVIEADLDRVLNENPEYREFRQFIDMKITPEGLRIEIKDTKAGSMFEAAQINLKDIYKNILMLIAERIRFVPNYIAVEGHTNSLHYASKRNGIMYSNWELSSDRANATRRFLIKAGMDPEQIIRVTGRADTVPANMNNPSAPENRRISLILLKQAIIPKHKQTVPSKLHENPTDIELNQFLELDGGLDDKGRAIDPKEDRKKFLEKSRDKVEKSDKLDGIKEPVF